MGAVIGLIMGIGLCLIFFALTSTQVPRERSATWLSRLVVGLDLRLAVMGFGVAGGSAALVWLATGGWAVAASFAAISTLGPLWWKQGRATRSAQELGEVWPEVVDNLASAVRAGLSLPEALASLAVRGPGKLRAAFAQFAANYEVTGRFGECLDHLKVALADATGDRMIEGIRIAHEVGGGDLGRLLRNLSGYLREETRTRNELESRQAWTINGARLAVAAPWLVLLVLGFQPQVLMAYNTSGGAWILILGAGVSVIAYLAMIRIGQLPTADRLMQ
jgi:tight adherence protein B